MRPPCTVLCRTNAGLFEAAIRGRDRFHIVGGLEPLARLILGGWQLHQGQPVPDLPSLARFRSWDELLEEADEARDPELRFLVQIIVHHGRALPGLVADLRRRAVPHPAAAERVLATAHKAKDRCYPVKCPGSAIQGQHENALPIKPNHSVGAGTSRCLSRAPKRLPYNPAATPTQPQHGGEVMDEPNLMETGPSASETWDYVRAPWGLQLRLVSRVSGRSGAGL